MIRFQVRHKIFGHTREFDAVDAPSWLTSSNTVPGSTMDTRWFWTDYVLTLAVGESTETDFYDITRIS